MFRLLVSPSASSSSRRLASSFVRRVHTLPALPYPLEKGVGAVITPQQLDFHYNKHHKAYVDKCNALFPGTPFDGQSIEQVMIATAKDANHAAIFNNAAQHWNHSFYWKCMTPKGSEMSSPLKDRLTDQFGSVDAFKQKFTEHALALFGSGWTWLAENKNGKLEIVNRSNAGNPLTDGHVPLLTIDVWEHAYYLDHQNRRPEYVSNWWNVVNWQFVEQNLRS